MTIDIEELKRLASCDVCQTGEWVTEEWALEHFGSPAEAKFVAAANPQVILALLEHIRRLESANIAQRKMLGICNDDELDGVRYRDED